MKFLVCDLMDFVSLLKGFYYSAEDKWYDFLDLLDRKGIAVYSVIDPVDSVVPSFLLFILTFIFLLVFVAYILQFYSPVEFTFTAVDSVSSQALSGVAISGLINDSNFSKITGADGVAKVVLKGSASNLFERLFSLFFAQEFEYSSNISAEKSGYHKIVNQKKDLSSKGATVELTAIDGVDDNKFFASSTVVELVDTTTNQRIVDPKGTAYISYNCSNNSSSKTSSDNYDGLLDGAFKLTETGCAFVVKGAYSPGYEQLNGLTIRLPPTEELHTIKLTKISNPTKGVAKIYVSEKNSSPLLPLGNIQITLLDLMGNSFEEGVTDFSGVFSKEVYPGTYIITATSLDGNYSAIKSDENQLIVVKVDTLSEKAILMQRLDPKLQRFLKIKVIDYNGRGPLKDVQVFPQNLIVTSDGNRTAKGSVGACTNGCRTDSNGFITISGLNSEDEGRIVVSLFKEGYVVKAFEPTVFKINTIEFETIELEKIDYNSTGNSGKGLVLVRAKNDLHPLSPSTAYLYFNSPELNIGAISLIKSGIVTNSNGEALFEGVRERKDKVYYAGTNYEGLNGISLTKSMEIGKTVLFDINIDTEISFLEVDLVRYDRVAIVDKARAIVKITSNSQANPFSENLIFDNSSKTFKSKLHEKGREYTLTVDLNNYVPISTQVNLSVEKRNFKPVIMVPSRDNILVLFNGLFESVNATESATFLDLNNYIDAVTKGYYAKVSYVVGKSLLDGNVLGMLRVNDKMNVINIDSVTQDYFKKSAIYSCTPQEKFPFNDNNYYIQSTNCESDVGKQSSVMWDENVAAGIYEVTTKLVFSPNAKNGDKLDFNYSGKQNDLGSVSEDRNRVNNYIIGNSICKYGVMNPSCSGIFFFVDLNNTSIGAESFNYDPTNKRFSKITQRFELQKGIGNSLKVNLFNNHSTKIDLNLKVYAYNGLMDSFNYVPNGVLHFDSNTGPQQKTIGSNISVNPFEKSVIMNVDVFTTLEKVSSYIVLVAELSNNEKYFLFIDTISPGRKLDLLGGDFFSGLPEQKFNANVVTLYGGIPADLELVRWRTLRNCDEANVVQSGVADINNINKDFFSMTIPGVYEYKQDCLVLNIKAKELVYDELTKVIYAGVWDVKDPELSCITPVIINSSYNQQSFLQWGGTAVLRITNNCSEQILTQVESRLLLSGVETCGTLNPKQNCLVTITAQNKDYNSNIAFSDILGVFPVYIKAKLANSRKNFSQIKIIKVHVNNGNECFAIDRDIFDLLKDSTDTSVVINNSCQYTDFGDYFIPKAKLDFSGVDLNDAKPKYDFIDINYSLNVHGGTYGLQQIQIPRVGIQLNSVEFAEDHPQETVGAYKKYKNFHMEIPASLNAYSNWVMFKWVDDTADNTTYGAKIDGSIKITYADNSTQLVKPGQTFDISSEIRCITDPTGVTGPGDHCIEPTPEEAPNMEGGNTVYYGLAYTTFPRGKIKSIDFDVIGNPNPANLIIATKVFVDYNETQTISVPNGEFATTTLSTGTFRIYPMEGMSFLLRNYTNPQMSEIVKERVNFCKVFLTNNAWVGDTNIYWVNRHYLNYAGAASDCNSIYNRIFNNSTNQLVSNFQSIPISILQAWNSHLNDFNWVSEGEGKGFWTNECTQTTCKTINKTVTGFGNESILDTLKFDIDSYAPLCEQQKPIGFAMTAESCNALGVICDPVNQECNETTPFLFDSFASTGFIQTINPVVEFVINGAKTNNVNLDNSAVKIWIEGGILKAMFVGQDYEGYNDKSIELNIINKDVIGDVYGTLNIIDYVNAAH